MHPSTPSGTVLDRASGERFNPILTFEPDLDPVTLANHSEPIWGAEAENIIDALDLFAAPERGGDETNEPSVA